MQFEGVWISSMKNHLPSQDASKGVTRKYSFEFISSVIPVNAAITMDGKAIVRPKSNIKMLFAELANTFFLG